MGAAIHSFAPSRHTGRVNERSGPEVREGPDEVDPRPHLESETRPHLREQFEALIRWEDEGGAAPRVELLEERPSSL
jgi:hypothetical protein